jgi:O-succinylbenzoic acid--CoA ligase
MNIPFFETFCTFHNLIFFESENQLKTYADFQNDITQTAKFFNFSDPNLIKKIVNNSDQYLFLVEIFTLWSLNKVPILISPKATTQTIEGLVAQVSFDLNKLDTEALILFTSGSTQYPKGVSLTFSNLLFHIKSFTNFFSAKTGEVFFLNLPLNHVGGLMLCLRSFFNGGKISCSPSACFDYISLVPHQLNTWINSPLLIKKLLAAKAILIGGGVFSPTLIKNSKRLNLPIYETYGMTETTSFIAINGNILPGVELSIQSDCAINIKGPLVALGYYVNKCFYKIPDFLETNDLGHIDAENKFSFKGRKGSQLISGGENISPLEIETVALSIEGVNFAKVCGVNDEKWGDIVIILYESNTISPHELKQAFKNNLHPYHIPKFIFQTDILRNNSIKISNQELKQSAYELFLKNIFSFTYSFTSNDKPTLVILHGFMENMHDWNFIIPHFKENYNILIIDLPGHGNTDIHNFSSLTEILSRLKDLIFLFSTKPILIGYSMGGRIALNLAENFIKPQKLILISASLGLNSTSEKIDRFKADSELFKKVSNKDTLKNFFYEWYSLPIFKPYFNSPQFASEVLQKSELNYLGWSQSLCYFSQGNFPLKKNSPFSYPIYFIAGTEDPKYSILDIPNKTLIKHAGHNPHKTHVQELVTTLIKQLEM